MRKFINNCLELLQENLDLRDEIANQEAKIENFAKTQEHFRKAADILRQKKQSHIAAEVELKQTLRSTLDDLALVTEKALQIEMEHTQIVRDLENQLQNHVTEKESVVERYFSFKKSLISFSLKRKYEQELEFKEQEIDELKKKNNRLTIEKEGLLKSLVKTKEEPSQTKLTSLEIVSPNLRSQEFKLEKSPKMINLTKPKDGKENMSVSSRSTQLPKQSLELKNNFKNTDYRLEKYKEHSNNFHIDIKALQQQLNTKQKNQEDKKNNDPYSKQTQIDKKDYQRRVETVPDELSTKVKLKEINNLNLFSQES